MRYDRVLLFSGGVDSFIAYHFLKKPQTIYFDLKTPYSDKEKQIVKQLIPTTIIDDSLSLGNRQIGEKAYIPFRNLYLAMLAVHYSDTITIVGIKGDDVSDKNEFIFGEFSTLLTVMEGRPIEVYSPFWEMTKEDIVKIFLRDYGSKEDLLKTISCYSHNITDRNYCGKCPSCFRKWVAFRSNGIDIDFYNKKLMGEYYKSATQGKYVRERNTAIVKVIEMEMFKE